MLYNLTVWVILCDFAFANVQNVTRQSSFGLTQICLRLKKLKAENHFCFNGKGAKPMNEVKQEDVMRALELCKSFRDLHACDVCPYFRAELGDDESCTNRMAQDALALLREKDAEIDRLTTELQAMRSAANSLKMHYESARSEAITEFEERLIKYYDALKSGLVAYHIKEVAKELKEDRHAT
jgi:hypothetical protein